MILQKLCELASRISDIPPSMYSPLEIKWQIELDKDGNYRGITPLSGGTDSNRGLRLLVPNRKRSGTSPPPLLLTDKANYVLGLGAECPSKSWRFAAFKELVDECAHQTGEPTVRAVNSFLNKYEQDPSVIPAEDLTVVDQSDMMTFRVDDIRPIDLPSVREFWADKCSEESSKMQCIVCGRIRPVDRVSPIAIKGIPGGQPSGTQIVSANKEAFESYGLTQALTAPTCRKCGEAYAHALNYMLKEDDYHVSVGPVAFVFWTSQETGFNAATMISDPQPEEVRKLIESYKSREKQFGLDATAFYSLSLSASGGRAVIRDWIYSTVPRVQANLARWFALQKIVEWDGTDPQSYFGLGALARALLPPKATSDQLPKNVPRDLVRCALQASPLPSSFLAQVLLRNKAEQQVTRARAALAKVALLSQIENVKEGYMEKLDETCKSAGYLCGRLLAELEAAQRLATDPKSTLVDRYYGAASSAPATVFGYLLRDFQVAHLSKLRKNNPAVCKAIDHRVQDILKDLVDFPKTLSVKEQALFSLGYYHQKAQDRAEAREKKELKELQKLNEEEE